MTPASTDVVLRLRPDTVSWREVDGDVVAFTGQLDDRGLPARGHAS